MTIDDVILKSESARWVELQMYRGCLIVLPREQFRQGLRRGKWWKRAAAIRARVAEREVCSDDYDAAGAASRDV